MERLIFVTLASPGQPILKTFLLLESLRKFGGQFAENPVWVLYPAAAGRFSRSETRTIRDLGGSPLPVKIDPGPLDFPLGAKVQAAAAVEEQASGTADLLAWLDEDTLILNEPDEFLLPGHRCLGFRPVHHKLLGTQWGQELDDFWMMIYQQTGADPERDFRMITHTGEQIRPYFNAGSYVVRPERGLLRGWWEKFQSCYQDAEFRSLYKRDPLYAVFMHQAVLTGTILGEQERNELQRLSNWINYPLHLHKEIPKDLRAVRIDDLLTVRYENILLKPGWREELPFSEGLADWISSKIEGYAG